RGGGIKSIRSKRPTRRRSDTSKRTARVRCACSAKTSAERRNQRPCRRDSPSCTADLANTTGFPKAADRDASSVISALHSRNARIGTVYYLKWPANTREYYVSCSASVESSQVLRSMHRPTLSTQT